MRTKTLDWVAPFLSASPNHFAKWRRVDGAASGAAAAHTATAIADTHGHAGWGMPDVLPPEGYGCAFNGSQWADGHRACLDMHLVADGALYVECFVCDDTLPEKGQTFFREGAQVTKFVVLPQSVWCADMDD